MADQLAAYSLAIRQQEKSMLALSQQNRALSLSSSLPPNTIHSLRLLQRKTRLS